MKNRRRKRKCKQRRKAKEGRGRKCLIATKGAGAPVARVDHNSRYYALSASGIAVRLGRHESRIGRRQNALHLI